MKTYTGEYTRKIKFPLGGIGTGCVSLTGAGQLADWEIFNRPNMGSFNGFSNLGIRALEGDKVLSARLLNGDIMEGLDGSCGQNQSLMSGFPHFRNWSFTGAFPMCNLNFSDPDFPGDVVLTAFNPMIPLEDDESSLPCAFFTVAVNNPTDKSLVYETAFSVNNPYHEGTNLAFNKDGVSGLLLKSNAEGVGCGELSVASDGECVCQAYWYRGGWQDNIATFWREFSEEPVFKERTYDSVWERPDRNDTGTLLVKTEVAPGETKTVRLVLSWHVPYCVRYWEGATEEERKKWNDLAWKNYYTKRFKNSVESAVYAVKNFETLLEKTQRFTDILHSSTLPSEVIDAASSTLSVLKTPTVLRLEDGSFYGWEGTHEKVGSCEGTCQHVWNYAYALCFLFPKLERSIRENEFIHCTDGDGKTSFRMLIPFEHHAPWDFIPCLDGQMGCLFKSYREWLISGDNEWLKKWYPTLKKIMDFTFSEKNICCWDSNMDGVLEGRQHHTLDMELFGPSSWLEGMYLCALKAMERMAKALGEEADSRRYAEIFEKGKAWTDQNLFNGRYYHQKIDLCDRSIIEKFNAVDYFNYETGEIKYQIGEGSEIDQLLGQWHADILNLGDMFDKNQRRTALEFMYENNFKRDMRSFANPWRVFSLNDESGAVICDYPDGVYKPKIPIPYCEETMHGFEYSFAGLLIAEGYITEGLSVVRSVRDRYDGKKRNPFD
ncbi:MAG: hypothetical protein KBS41_00550, partial [Oscillospiraceae bacterium]|nr:hypothetical protein [Candidatus Equicaccousia limihippi]